MSSYAPRSYEAIVRDMLTVLTGGTVAETVDVPAESGPIKPAKLKSRPVRRISYLEGVVEVRSGTATRLVPYRFTNADFELVSADGTGELDTIAFRKDGKKPAPGSTLIVNYYPLATREAPLTDLNVGSVTRTLVETFGREIAQTQLYLDHVYRSAFLDTAESNALDSVVALVGVRRLAPGHPVVRLRLSRRAGNPGRITVPSGTAVTDDAGNRYLTTVAVTFEPNETTRDVLAMGESPSTQPVAENKLNRFEVLLASVSEVNNPEPARQLASGENDDELRNRARGALHGATRGTYDALEFAVRSVPGVKDVRIVEFPNDLAGEVRVDVAYSDDRAEVAEQVRRAVAETRPVGIRVLLGEPKKTRIQVRIELTLAGAGLPPKELDALDKSLEQRVFAHLSAIGSGGRVRRAKLSSLALEDARVADAKIVLVPDGKPEVEEIELKSGEILDIVRPFAFPAPKVDAPAASIVAATARVSAILPIDVAMGATEAQARAAIDAAITSHLASRRPDKPLTFSGFADVLKAAKGFALRRADGRLTVESDGAFVQLSDGVGTYAPPTGQTLEKGDVSVEPKGKIP